MPAPQERERATAGAAQVSPSDGEDDQASAPVRVPLPTATVRRGQIREDWEGTAYHPGDAQHPPPPRPTRADRWLTCPEIPNAKCKPVPCCRHPYPSLDRRALPRGCSPGGDASREDACPGGRERALKGAAAALPDALLPRFSFSPRASTPALARPGEAAAEPRKSSHPKEQRGKTGVGASRCPGDGATDANS